MLSLPEQNVHWLMAVILQLMQLPPPPGALALSSEQPSCLVLLHSGCQPAWPRGCHPETGAPAT